MVVIARGRKAHLLHVGGKSGESGHALLSTRVLIVCPETLRVGESQPHILKRNLA